MHKFTIAILLIFHFLSLKIYCQSYPIPAEEAQWGIVTMYGPPGVPGAGSNGSIARYDVKDTIINDMTYQAWQSVYTRYSNNKLFVINPFETDVESKNEKVYYDFNLAENDSFLLPFWIDSTYAKVNDVSEFKALNGQIRKQITLTIEDITCGHTLKWIEGIGDIHSGVLYMAQIGLCDINSRVVCFLDVSGSVYKEENRNHPCEDLDTYVRRDDDGTGVESAEATPKITIVPNPVIDKLVINTDYEFLRARIINLNGLILLELNSKEIDCSNLKSGVYLLELLNQDYTVEIIRVVKK